LRFQGNLFFAIKYFLPHNQNYLVDGRPGLLGCAIAAASRVLKNEAMQARAK
jgi:hypothetical protein